MIQQKDKDLTDQTAVVYRSSQMAITNKPPSVFCRVIQMAGSFAGSCSRRWKIDALSRLFRAIHASVPPCGAQKRFFLFSLFVPLSSAYAAEGTRPAYTAPPPAVSSGSIVQIIFSLLLVLAAIVLVAWLLKRMNVAQQGSGHLLKVLGGVSIGQRERIVLVEVKDTWLVVGIGPGQIRTLHALPKAEIPADDLQSAENLAPENKFAGLLSSIIGHRKNGAENR